MSRVEADEHHATLTPGWEPMDDAQAARVLEVLATAGHESKSVAAPAARPKDRKNPFSRAIAALVVVLAAAALLLSGFTPHPPVAAASLTRPGDTDHAAFARNRGEGAAQEQERPMKTLIVVTAGAVIAAGAGAQTDAVQWRVEDGGNGHWYRIILVSTPLTWSEARAVAHNAGGSLLSVNSAGEQSFMRPLLVSAKDEQGCNPAVFIGLSKQPGADWRWEDGTALTYTNWACGEPYDPDYPEGKMVMYNPAGCESQCVPHLFWNDIRFGEVHPLHRGIAVEWSADCNADGIVDYGQVLNGHLADANANGIPDSCECTGDINGDDWVDGVDLGLVLASWSGSASGINADLNHDGSVDGLDLGILLSFWGPCSP